MYSIRIRFTRGEDVKFISHLDLMKAFERAIRRAGLPIAYSQGFNPHPQMVFGLPLPVGVTSDGEYADFELVRQMDPEEFMTVLNGSLPGGIQITAAGVKNIKTNIMAAISAADYLLDIFLNEMVSLEEVAAKVDKMMKMQCIKVLKEGKDSAKEIDIRPLILSVKPEELMRVPSGYEGFKTAFAVRAGFKAGSAANLRPELFIKALTEHAGLPVAASRLHRMALYVEKNGRQVSPLNEIVLNDI